jgi:hypothetical protein
VGAVLSFEHGDVFVMLAGEDGSEAVAVVVGEEELRAGMGAARDVRSHGPVTALALFDPGQTPRFERHDEVLGRGA